MMTNVTSPPPASKHKGRNWPACRALRLTPERLKALGRRHPVAVAVRVAEPAALVQPPRDRVALLNLEEHPVNAPLDRFGAGRRRDRQAQAGPPAVRVHLHRGEAGPAARA